MTATTTLKSLAALLTLGLIGGGGFFIYQQVSNSKYVFTKAPYLVPEDFINSNNISNKFPSGYFLSTNSEENESEWNERLGVVNKKLGMGAETGNTFKAPSENGFFKTITKNDPDILEKVKKGCEEFYRSEKPGDNTIFTEARWVEATMFCGRGSYAKPKK